MDGDPTPALTGRRRTRPPSIGCPNPWQPKPGRAPLIAAHAAVQTNRATSNNHLFTFAPHASLGYRPPAPEVFVPAFAAWPAAPPRPASPARLTLAQRPTLN